MKFCISCVALLSILCTQSFAQGDFIEYTILMGGKKAGALTRRAEANGTYVENMQYNDRGRGDSIVTRYRQNERGFITSLEGSGVDYYKKPIQEKFKISNGIASWENPDEKDQRQVSGDVSYLALKIRAGISYSEYFSTPDHTVKLLPSGSSKLVVLMEKVVGNRKVRLISVSGTGLTPTYTWIDQDNTLFAIASDWFAVLRKGYENLNDTLLITQKKYEQEYFKNIATNVRQRVAGGIAITNARVFDTRTGTVSPSTTILVENGLITKVSQETSIPKGYTTVDAANKFVMPGLWDMHVHYSDPTDGILDLACGVTSVRDMGNAESLFDKKKDIDNGTVLGPRIQIMCGFIDGAGPYAGPTGAKISTVEEGIAAVKHYKSLGYAQIKLYSSLKPEWVKPIADEAHRNGMRVSGHIPAHMLASEAIDAGYDEIQHMNMVFLNFLGKELDTRTPLRFHAVAQNASKLDLSSKEVTAFMKQLKERKIVIDPTVSFFETMFVPQNGKPVPTMAAVADRLPPELQRSFKSGGALEVPNGQEAVYAASFQKMLEMIKLLHDNGITIVPGTDDFVGFVLHKELENYSKAGTPNADVLKIATLQSAKVAGKEKEFGSLEPGKVADIIIIDGDPLRQMSDIRRVQTIIKGQDIYKSSALCEAISIEPLK
jgi:hypothetical protein